MIDINQAFAFSKEDLNSLCDYGLYNSTIAGYLIEAMRIAGFKEMDIGKAFRGLRAAFDTVSAEEAKDIFAERLFFQ